MTRRGGADNWRGYDFFQTALVLKQYDQSLLSRVKSDYFTFTLYAWFSSSEE